MCRRRRRARPHTHTYVSFARSAFPLDLSFLHRGRPRDAAGRPAPRAQRQRWSGRRGRYCNSDVRRTSRSDICCGVWVAGAEKSFKVVSDGSTLCPSQSQEAQVRHNWLFDESQTQSFDGAMVQRASTELGLCVCSWVRFGRLRSVSRHMGFPRRLSGEASSGGHLASSPAIAVRTRPDPRAAAQREVRRLQALGSLRQSIRRSPCNKTKAGAFRMRSKQAPAPLKSQEGGAAVRFR